MKFIKKLLGIDVLESRIESLSKENIRLNQLIDSERENNKKESKRVLDSLSNVHLDNKLVLRHLEFINKDFSVGADISGHNFDPSIVLVMRKGVDQKDNVIKYYTFDEPTTQNIYRMLEGFGKNNVRLDMPPGRREGPAFRF